MVVIDGIRLPVYVVGGLNVSVGELSRVVHANVYVNRASGAPGIAVSGLPYDFVVGSGSGNIVTIMVGRSGSTELGAGIGLSNFPLGLVAWGA